MYYVEKNNNSIKLLNINLNYIVHQEFKDNNSATKVVNAWLVTSVSILHDSEGKNTRLRKYI